MDKIGVGMIVTGVLMLLGVGASVAYENHETNKKVGKSLEELKKASIKDISEGLIREAVGTAASQAVNKYVSEDNERILNRAYGQLSSKVTALVNERYTEVTKDVSDRLAAQVAKLDHPDRIRNAVQEKAKDILVSRFEKDLDDLKEKAMDAYDSANDRYEERLDDAIEKFEEKLDEKLDGYSENLASMKKVYDSIDRVLGRRGDRDGKEIRLTLG